MGWGWVGASGWGGVRGGWAMGFGGGGTEILGICLMQWLLHMVKISSKSEVFQFSEGQNPLLRGTYNNRKKLKFWGSALFSG